MLVFIFWLIFLILFLLILGTFAYAGLIAAPWVPLWQKDVRRMLTLAQIKPGEILYDLGAGDGRIIIMAAKEFGATAVGFEIAVLPYLLGLFKIRLQGLGGKAILKYADFYRNDLSQADVICTFLTPQAMIKLKSKLKKEIKPGGRIVSYAFSLLDWPAEKIDKPSQKSTTIYLYRKSV